jgi:uncharacterized integral membrane protein
MENKPNRKEKIKDILLYLLLIIVINTATVSIVLGGKHISPNTVSWVDGAMTVVLINAILRRLGLRCICV